jgi:predicted dehydrogenase
MKYKVLILGLGRIASILEKDTLRYHPCTHAGVILNSPLAKHFQVKGIFDIDPAKITEFLSFWKLNINNILTDLEKIRLEKFDLCIVASTSSSHFLNTQFAIQLGIKNILIEKPICTKEAELKKLIKLAIKNEVKIWVNHERRYHPLYQYVRNKLLNREWGSIKTIHASVLTSGLSPGLAFEETGGGPLLHDGTHAIDYLDFLFGKRKKVHFAKFHIPKSQKTESRALAVIEYPQDVFAFLEAGGERRYFQFEVDIQTSEYRIILNNDGHKLFKSEESSLYKGFRSLKPLEFPQFKNSNPWIELYNEILQHLQGKGKEILGDLSANQRIFDLIKEISIQKK